MVSPLITRAFVGYSRLKDHQALANIILQAEKLFLQ